MVTGSFILLGMLGAYSGYSLLKFGNYRFARKIVHIALNYEVTKPKLVVIPRNTA